jgi:hypothetical protein
MSYDLMLFEPEAPPRGHQGFMEWYSKQVEWGEGHTYNDPAISSERLQKFFSEIIVSFPPLNGVFAEEDLPEDEATATDYSVGREVIYACFSWSKTESAYEAMFNLAAKNGLGFFNVSSETLEVWLPGPEGLVLAHQKTKPSFLEKLFKRNHQ